VLELYGSVCTQVENQRNIQNVREAILFLQQFLGTVEGKNAPSGKKAPTLGDFDFPIWNDQVIMATFGMSSKTIYRRRKDGTFKGELIGGIYYYSREDILPFRCENLK
jgi:hypothetical protein